MTFLNRLLHTNQHGNRVSPIFAPLESVCVQGNCLFFAIEDKVRGEMQLIGTQCYLSASTATVKHYLRKMKKFFGTNMQFRLLSLEIKDNIADDQ